MDQWDKNAPILNDKTITSKEDPHEVLLSNEEVSEDETLDDLVKEHK